MGPSGIESVSMTLSGHAGISAAAAFGLFYILVIPRNLLSVLLMTGIARTSSKKDMRLITKLMGLNVVVVTLAMFLYIFSIMWKHGNMYEVSQIVLIEQKLEDAFKENSMLTKAEIDVIMQQEVNNLLASNNPRFTEQKFFELYEERWRKHPKYAENTQEIVIQQCPVDGDEGSVHDQEAHSLSAKSDQDL